MSLQKNYPQSLQLNEKLSISEIQRSFGLVQTMNQSGE